MAQTSSWDSLAVQKNLTHVFDKNIKSLTVTFQDFDLAQPIIFLESDDIINISFDELNGSNTDFYVQLVHCNANWQTSEISSFDYLDGFNDIRIDNRKNAFNTKFNYVHYTFPFPNQDMRPKISGNYLLKIYSQNTNEPHLQIRVFVVESICPIEATILPCLGVESSFLKQCISAKVGTKSIDDDNQYGRQLLSVYQNFNPFKNIEIKEPQSTAPQWLNFDANNQTFWGGNEFRDIDLRSLEVRGVNVRRIYQTPNQFEALAEPEPTKGMSVYTNKIDVNGNFAIEMARNGEADVEADYISTTFTLMLDAFINDGTFYIVGDFNQWTPSSEYQLNFIEKSNFYQTTFLLKQGYYNYQFVFVPKGKTSYNHTLTEGDHYETENQYQVFYYYRNFNGRADRLVGYQSVKSRF